MDHRPGAGRNAFHDSSTGRLWVPELLAKAQSAGVAIRITKARLDLAARVRIRFRTRVPRYQLSNPKRECKEQGQSNRFHSNFLREIWSQLIARGFVKAELGTRSNAQAFPGGGK